MKKSNLMYIDKMKIYFSFIQECRNKSYDENFVLHNHHILPRFIYGKNTELIKLSVDDHIKAHILLADCYEDDSYENIHNLRSARILNKKSIKDVDTLKKISDTYLGEKNPFYGKKHTKNTKEKLAEKASMQCKYVSYEIRYGDRAEIEKDKRSLGVKKYWNALDKATKDNRSEKIRQSLLGNMVGERNAMSKKVEIDGIIYGSIKLASKQLGISTYFVKKKNTFKYI